MGKTHSRNTGTPARNKRAARAAIGTACIAAAVLAFGYFALHVLPGQPGTPLPDQATGRMQAATGSSLAAECIVDVPAGAAFRAEGLGQSSGHATGAGESAPQGNGKSPLDEGTQAPHADAPALDVAVVGFKAASDDAFKEWFPHYAEADPRTDDAEAKVVLVFLRVANPGDAAAAFPFSFKLWSNDFAGASDRIGNGLYAEESLIDELYGVPQEGFVPYAAPDGWNVLAPGQTREFACPFLVYRNAFADPAAYDDMDPARFCLAFYSCDPPTAYRLWLG